MSGSSCKGGIAFDTTGMRPSLPISMERCWLCFPNLPENPNAMFVLWKDHTATKEAAEINKLCKEGDRYSAYEGGIYSSNGFWAKALHLFRADKSVREGLFHREHIADGCRLCWLAWTTAAGGSQSLLHVVIRPWHEKWNGLPSEAFPRKLDPLLKVFPCSSVR